MSQPRGSEFGICERLRVDARQPRGGMSLQNMPAFLQRQATSCRNPIHPPPSQAAAPSCGRSSPDLHGVSPRCCLSLPAWCPLVCSQGSLLKPLVPAVDSPALMFHSVGLLSDGPGERVWQIRQILHVLYRT